MGWGRHVEPFGCDNLYGGSLYLAKIEGTRQSYTDRAHVAFLKWPDRSMAERDALAASYREFNAETGEWVDLYGTPVDAPEEPKLFI